MANLNNPKKILSHWCNSIDIEFDNAMLDLTNFLAYMTDPLKIERETIGTYTLLYLIIFTMLSYLLYREFKKDLH